MTGTGRKTTRTAILLALLLGLAGCNTVAGAGRDITAGANRVGNWIGG